MKKLLMNKFLLFGATLAMSLMISAPSIQAQVPTEAEQAKMMEEFKKEPPLTQKDIDTFIKIMPELAKIGNDEAKAIAISKKNGFTEMRVKYVNAKMQIAWMVISQGGDQTEAFIAQIPEHIRPTKDELALVKKNDKAIQKVYMETATPPTTPPAKK